MKITEIRFGMLRVPLKTPFKTALRTVEQVEDVVVMVHTDTGHVGSGGQGAFALNSDGTLNWQLINDFSYVGIHAMTVTAKAVIAAYYGSGPKYSYFNGCSTGGRLSALR